MLKRRFHLMVQPLALAALLLLTFAWQTFNQPAEAAEAAQTTTNLLGDQIETFTAASYTVDVRAARVVVTTTVTVHAKETTALSYMVLEPDATCIAVMDPQSNPLTFSAFTGGSGQSLNTALQLAQRQGRQVFEVALPMTLQPGQEFAYVISYWLPPFTNISSRAPSFASSNLTATVRLLSDQRADFTVRAWGDQASLQVVLPQGWEAFARNSGLYNANLQSKGLLLVSESATSYNNSLLLRAEIEATALSAVAATTTQLTLPPNQALQAGTRSLDLELDFWSYDQAGRDGVAPQLSAILPLMERFTGQPYPGPAKLRVREISGLQSKGLGLVGFNFSANSLKYGANEVNSDLAEIQVAQPGPLQAAQLTNGLCHLWTTSAHLAAGWLTEGYCTYLTQRVLKNLNLSYELDSTFNDALLNWQSGAGTGQKGVSIPSGLDHWQPLTSLVGISRDDQVREANQYLAATGLMLQLNQLAGAGDDFLAQMLPRVAAYSRYYPLVGTHEFMDLYEATYDLNNDPNFEASLDRYFEKFVMAQKDWPLLEQRRNLWETLFTFKKQFAEPAKVALSGRLQRLTADWNFGEARQELEQGRNLITQYLAVQQLALDQHLTLPPRIQELLEGLQGRSTDLRFPNRPREVDIFGYAEALGLVEKTLGAGQKIVELRAFLQRLLQAGYTQANPEFLERQRLDREAVQSLAFGDVDHARALAEQGLGEALPIAARPVIPSNTFQIPNANDSWRRALPLGVGGLVVILIALGLARSVFLFRRIRKRL
jgi:hypothetical protein